MIFCFIEKYAATLTTSFGVGGDGDLYYSSFHTYGGLEMSRSVTFLAGISVFALKFSISLNSSVEKLISIKIVLLGR
jgi:hypothetical protein